ncbi:hypothetical protein CDCA_CDCA13G3553 [Cyanidium caldarium]|uniref:PPM-type phosphatase domain-containing protein n=1 Tax=Cyanidium caldarium TaxID=2771 RepID=A0AAV9J0I1_CYACA|nr:hypothetical protein CDCA_CDCA13G3553 [Cyanidium caldarium]
MGLCKSKFDSKVDDSGEGNGERGASSGKEVAAVTTGVGDGDGGRTAASADETGSADAGAGRLSVDRRADTFLWSLLTRQRRNDRAADAVGAPPAAVSNEGANERAHRQRNELGKMFDESGAVIGNLPITKHDGAAEVVHSDLQYDLPLQPPGAVPAVRLSVGVVSRTGWEPVRKGKENQDSACVLMPLVPAWTCASQAPKGGNELAKPCDCSAIQRQHSKRDHRLSTPNGLDNMDQAASRSCTFDDPEAALATVTVMTPRHHSRRHLPLLKGADVRYHDMILDAGGERLPPHVLSDGLWGVFDGHGVAGRLCSHYIRNVFPKLLARYLYDRALYKDPAEALRRTCRDAETLLTARGELLELAPESDAFAYLWSNVKSTLHRSLGAHGAGGNSGVRASIDSMPEVEDDDDGLGGIDSRFSGTTGIVVLMHGADLYCANVGDSRAVLGRRAERRGGRHTAYEAVPLSQDHKPDRPDERQRIEALGGHVDSWHGMLGPARVWLPTTRVPGLAMSRSFGDQVVENVGVTAEPEVYRVALCDGDAFFVLASDGVWEFMSNDDVVQFVGGRKDRGEPPQTVAEQLVQEAVRRWIKEETVIDDVTCIVVYLDAVGGGLARLEGGCGHQPQLLVPSPSSSSSSRKDGI